MTARTCLWLLHFQLSPNLVLWFKRHFYTTKHELNTNTMEAGAAAAAAAAFADLESVDSSSWEGETKARIDNDDFHFGGKWNRWGAEKLNAELDVGLTSRICLARGHGWRERAAPPPFFFRHKWRRNYFCIFSPLQTQLTSSSLDLVCSPLCVS